MMQMVKFLFMINGNWQFNRWRMVVYFDRLMVFLTNWLRLYAICLECLMSRWARIGLSFLSNNNLIEMQTTKCWNRQIAAGVIRIQMKRNNKLVMPAEAIGDIPTTFLPKISAFLIINLIFTSIFGHNFFASLRKQLCWQNKWVGECLLLHLIY